MASLNWNKVKVRNSLRKNKQLEFERLLKKKQTRAVNHPVIVPRVIREKRKAPPINMRPCANVFCVTFINKSSIYLFCSFHGKR